MLCRQVSRNRLVYTKKRQGNYQSAERQMRAFWLSGIPHSLVCVKYTKNIQKKDGRLRKIAKDRPIRYLCTINKETESW